MDYQATKSDLINFWGAIGTSWGINKTMAQIYAVLLFSDQPLSVEDLMKELNISRGNASMNIRALMNWGLAKKEVRLGERREYFVGEKDVWEMSRKVAAERKKQEIEPLLAKLEKVRNIDDSSSSEAKEFTKVAEELYELVNTFDLILNKFISSNNKLAIKSLKALLALT